jgi:ABC-type transport system involved in multi-copper enzyme maturation permease subunit
LVGLTRFFFGAFVREPVFLAIAVISVVNVAFAAWYVDTQYGVTIWPVTAEMASVVVGGSGLFLIILATIYAGEIVWRERQLRIDGTADALPVPTATVFIGKLLALIAILALILLAGFVATVAVQTLKGYHHYEFGLYAKNVLGIGLPLVINVTVLALFIHTIVDHKYIGHIAVVATYLLFLVLGSWGFERVLYQYMRPPIFIYSDMNAFGHYAASVGWVLAYHTAEGLVLVVGAYLLWVRGADDSWQARWRAVSGRWRESGTRLAAGGTALAAVAAGGVVFYNTAVLNPFVSSKASERRQAAYERDYRRFKDLAQPRIVGVRLRVDLEPERRAFRAQTVYRLVNKHARPLDTLYVSIPSVAFKQQVSDTVWSTYGYHLDSLVWSRPARFLIDDSTRGVYVYQLLTPLAPQDSMTLAFGAHFAANGFPDAHPNDDIVGNGTFFASDYFPSLTYDDGLELADDDVRKRYGFKPKDRMPSIHDTAARADNAVSRDADWIAFDATLSTAPDQIAIAPGYLQREWVENGRRMFTYHMDRPMLDIYSIQSARYRVLRDEYKGVAIEIYYHSGHEYDLDRMVEGTKRSLDYYTANFSPYQFHQYRIIEFPRYQVFAESFPNTVPYSEGIGFIARVRDRDDDLDWPLFVTAHEFAHQWWAHQEIPANMQGAAMLTESLAEYSALTVMEHKYGASQSQKFLRYELDRYLRGRANERKKEMPLMLVENQPYIHYSKGALAFYALRDYIGEDSLNAGLRRFLHDKAFQQPPYTTTVEFLPYMRAVTPDSLQYVIHDLFETITLYDNKATAATASRQADGSYAVHLTFAARKIRADSLGNQTDIPVADYIDVGVFGAKEKGNTLGKPLALRKVHVTQPTMSVDFTVSERPLKAGIDPYNKLIDRTPEDNVRSVDVAK